jgi:hypothetical protein
MRDHYIQLDDVPAASAAHLQPRSADVISVMEAVREKAVESSYINCLRKRIC